MHEGCEKLPAPAVDHATVPVGESPFTVAVQVDGIAAITVEGAQETEVLDMFGVKLSPISAHPSFVCA